MNICMLAGSFLPRKGGMEYAVHYLADALVDLGHTVDVWAAESNGYLDFVPIYNTYTYGCPSIPFSGRSGLDGWDAVRRISNQHRHTPYDVLHAHGVAYAGAIAVRLKERCKLPIVLTPHGEDVQRFPDIGYGLRLNPVWNRKIESWLVQADVVTAISDSIDKDIACVPKERRRNIPNGVVMSRFDGERCRVLQKRLGLKETTKIVLSVGRYHIKKGYADGIKAFALSELGKDFSVAYVLIGAGVSCLATLISELRLESSVFIIDAVSQEELTSYYKSADLFFSPSITEGLSLVSIEALAAGLPLLATDVPGNRDIVRDTGCGCLTDAKNPQSMGEALQRLIRSPDLLARYSSEAQLQSRRYDWREIAKSYVEVYRGLLDVAGGGKQR